MDFRRRRKVDATIDMTPMIDTLLQLFVVFLLSMSFVASAVRLELPRASVQQPAGDTPLVVAMDATGALFLNDAPVVREELEARLRSAFAEGKNRQVLLRADKSLTYDRVLETLVEVQRAGTSNVLLSYQPAN